MEFPIIDLKETGKKIKKLCKQEGYTPEKLMRILNLSCVQTVYRWFNGQNVPSIENFYALSLLLKVSMEDLLVIKEATNHSFFWQKNIVFITAENLFYKERMRYYIEKLC